MQTVIPNVKKSVLKQKNYMANLTRPLLIYHGGKWNLAPWILSYMPSHKIYVELFGGGGSILLRKKRSYAEIYNDLDSEIVNLFSVVRDRGGELINKLIYTPYSRNEYEYSFKKTDDPLELARRTVVRSFFGFGNTAVLYSEGDSRPGFRAVVRTSGSYPASIWRVYTDALAAIIERLRGVTIENKDAFDLILAQDSKDTLFYADPPYLPSTRDKGNDYRFEMTEAEHIELAKRLNKTKGAVMVSGYHSKLYDELYKDWEKREKKTQTFQNNERTEVLWLKDCNTEYDLFERA